MRQWLRQHLFHNFGIKFVAVALALTLYLHVFASQESEHLVEVPLALRGVPETLIWSGEIPRTATVRLRGVGFEFFKLRTHAEGARILVEVDDARPGRYQRPLVTEDVKVPSEIHLGVVELVSPRSIVLEFDRVLVRRLGVVPKVAGRPAPGYITFGRVTADPESVMVRGPERRLESFAFLQTEPVDIANRDASLTREATLRVPSECTALPAAVKVTVSIEKVISRTFSGLTVNVLHADDVLPARLTPQVGSVAVSGPAALVDSLTPADLRLSIDALGLPRGTYTLMASVELLRALRAGAVSLQPVQPEKFEVELE